MSGKTFTALLPFPGEEGAKFIRECFSKVNDKSYQGHPAHGLLITQYCDEREKGGWTLMIEEIPPERFKTKIGDAEIENYVVYDFNQLQLKDWKEVR